MSEIICLLVGFWLGGCIATTILCCVQINRTNRYEDKIQCLRRQLNNKK